MAWTDYINTVEKIYIAYYQRPADPEGLIFWAKMLDAEGGDLTKIIDAFANSPESQALYGEITEANIADVVKAIYNAAFNRDPEPAGLQYYVNGFKEGKFTPATIMLNILDGATGADKVVLENKIESALNFTKAIDPELDGKDLLVTYDSKDIPAAREFLKEVGASPSTVKTYEEAVNYVKEKIADPTDPILNLPVEPTTKALTLKDDTVVGTDGDDTIKAPVLLNTATGRSVDTLGPNDVIDGKGGEDTLVLYTTGQTLVFPSMSNVENLVIKNIGTANTVYYMDEVRGLKSVEVAPTNNAIQLYDLNNVVEVTDKNKLAGSLTVGYSASAVAGKNDEQKITVENAGNDNSPERITLQGGDIEKVSINSSGVENYVDLSTKGTKEISLSGDSKIKLTVISNTVDYKVDASSLKNSLIVSIDTAKNADVVGSDNDDSLIINNNDDDKFISFDGGKGNDTVYIERTTAATVNYDDNDFHGKEKDDALKNVEKVVIDDSNTGGVTLKLSNQSEGFEIVDNGKGNTIYGGQGKDTIKLQDDSAADNVVLDSPFSAADKVSDFESGTDKLYIDLAKDTEDKAGIAKFGALNTVDVRYTAAGKIKVFKHGTGNNNLVATATAGAALTKAFSKAAALTNNELFVGKSIVIDKNDNDMISINGASVSLAKFTKTAVLFFYDTDDHKLEMFGLYIKKTASGTTLTVKTHKTIATIACTSGNLAGTDIFIF